MFGLSPCLTSSSLLPSDSMGTSIEAHYLSNNTWQFPDNRLQHGPETAGG